MSAEWVKTFIFVSMKLQLQKKSPLIFLCLKLFFHSGTKYFHLSCDCFSYQHFLIASCVYRGTLFISSSSFLPTFTPSKQIFLSPQINTCYTVPCASTGENECLWTDWLLDNSLNGEQARQYACIRRSDTTCSWYRGGPPPEKDFLDMTDPWPVILKFTSLHLTPSMPQVRNISCFGLQYVARIWLPMLMCYVATDLTEKLADFIS